ncbi:MAG: histidyl-tRNA synthetase [Acidimicrobiaceae bacterium]|jgi:histidyl-tRNA synthetase|nr:histidyl-tRNA synthetase [Acidimicrobiaceae bacterium]
MSQQFQAPPGTFDVLPPDSARYTELVARFAGHASRAGFGLIVQPMFEDVGVFQRLGGSTDIVRKEMYDFEDKGGRHIALRPEGTAPVARAYVQHRPPVPWKVWYLTPKFRYERPQAGRFKQHHEVGAEALGTDDADLDVELIALAWFFYADLGLSRVRLLLNSLGDGTCRPAYRAALQAFLEARRDQLCDEHKDRIVDNPLRVLDCKRPACQEATKDAPRQLDHLCEPCAAHFARVTSGLDALGIPHTVETRLVRGMDYYTRTTFEFAAEALESAQNAVGGGGRYDGLVEQLGGPATPGIGFGLGIERILLACDAEGVFAVPESRTDVFIVDTTGQAATRLAHRLRQAGVRCDRAFDGRSMKAQMKAADRAGARLALIIGDDEAAAGTVSVRGLQGLRGEGGQETVAMDDVVDYVRGLLT